MRIYDILLKKRNGQELSEQEVTQIIKGYASGTVPDYQMAAFAMAVFFKGMSVIEISALTKAIVESGDQIDLSGIQGIKVDKHSTGGVGDKTTLVLGPLVASAGVPVAKMSGRGLGHTGGTIDKLEAIPGFRTDLSREEFIRGVNKTGIAICGQTGNLTPADKKLYALRDVTATVDSIPLIASSVMGKKIAAGANAIVLDVKVGSGAFMKSLDQAAELASTMVKIGEELGRKTVAVMTAMDEPLGYHIGNANEVMEAIQCLQGKGPEDLADLCLTLGSQMVYLAGKADSPETARGMLDLKIKDGSAFEKLKEMVENQGGDARYLDDPSLFPQASHTFEVRAEQSGFVSSIMAEEIGRAAMIVGAGRETKESHIDLSVGIRLNKKVGSQVEAGEALATLFVNDPAKSEEAGHLIRAAFSFADTPTKPSKLIKGIVTTKGIEIFEQK